MSQRKAACDPCRHAKLACGHEKPICTRCRLRKKADTCTYRSEPFKRLARTYSESIGSILDSPAKAKDVLVSKQPVSDNFRTQSRTSEPHESPSVPQRNHYPNPGYLGLSSHVSIYDQILSEQNTPRDPVPSTPSVAGTIDEHPSAKQGALLLRQLFERYDLKAFSDLVKFWRLKGVNLVVAAPLVDLSSTSVNYTSLTALRGPEWHLELSARLLQNTARPLSYTIDSTLAEYATQFTGVNTRWETLGIFIAAVLQATRDVAFFPPLYTSHGQNRELKKFLTRLHDTILEICLSADCLNDLQLVVQYENFIIHSYVDGDQSYRYWRTLGDTIASILALGYHEDPESKADCPRFLIELRKAVCVDTYTADKGVSVFLGRPLRLSKRFIRLKLPWCATSDGEIYAVDDEAGRFLWKDSTKITLEAGVCWMGICAIIKEDILELLYDKDCKDTSDRANALHQAVEDNWNALPPQFRYSGSLKQSQHTSFERDLLTTIRLNSLHLSFLLHGLFANRWVEPNDTIISVAQETLHLIVQAILLRGEMVNSGTGLDWKIAYYGLPSAGTLLLAMLRHRKDATCPSVPRNPTLANLTILAAEVERGTIVQREDPNYELLSQATSTIQRFLDNYIDSVCVTAADGNDVPLQAPGFEYDDAWLSQWDNNLRDFDIEFWQGLKDSSSMFAGIPAANGT